KNGGSAGESFKTSFVATTTLWPIDFEHHMADFPSRMAISTVKLTIDNQTATDPRPDENADDVLGLAFEFGHMHSECSDISIIFNKDRHSQVLLQFFFQRDILPAIHVRSEDYAAT